MTIVNSLIRSDLEFASVTNRQTDAENQNQSWLRQMELNQMTLLQQLGQQNSHEQQHVNLRAKSVDFKGDESYDIGSQTPELKSTSLLPIHPILAQKKTVASDFVSDNSLAIELHKSIQLTSSTELTADVFVNSSGLSADAFAKFGASVSLTLDQNNSAMPESVMVTNRVGISHFSAFSFTDHGAEPEQSDESIQIDNRPANSADADSDAATKTEWQKRLIHVSQQETNVSVSIRDTSLNAYQSSQIVSRLAFDAAQEGLTLKHATVNGKTIITSDRQSVKSKLFTSDLSSQSASSTLQVEPKE